MWMEAPCRKEEFGAAILLWETGELLLFSQMFRFYELVSPSAFSYIP